MPGLLLQYLRPAKPGENFNVSLVTAKATSHDPLEQRKTLSVLEHVVMDFLWSQGPASSEQVRAGLSGCRLEQTGYATHRLDCRT